MSAHLTSEQFLKDVGSHTMSVLHDDGVYRHLRFAKPGTSHMHFDIVTWPGYLAYTGDMGAFTFTRLRDMLDFFRTSPANPFNIDRRYWAEKCVAEGRHGDGVWEHDSDAFRREVELLRRCLMVRSCRGMNPEERKEVWDSLQEVVNLSDDANRCWVALYDWRHTTWSGKTLRLDCDEPPRCLTYTRRFQWCCYALAWAVHQYDSHLIAREAA